MDQTASTVYAPFSGDEPFIIHGLEQDQSVFQVIQRDHLWEPHLIAVLQKIIRPGFVCLDVGANIGAITLVLARLAEGGQVYAFEASRESAAILRRNVTENQLANVTVVEKAVAARSGETVDLYTLPGHPGTAHLSTHLGRDGQEPQQVATLALDDYPVTLVDFIKLDIEGSEIPALEGARKLIQTQRPILVVEYNPTPARWFTGASKRALYDLLRELYPNIAIIQAGGLEPVPDWDTLDQALPDGVWCDLLCRDFHEISPL